MTEKEVLPHADAALRAFRVALEGPAAWQRADRASTLHMLKGLAPRFFHRHALRAELDQALEALESVPSDFSPGLDLDEGMSRVDALYFRQVNGWKVKPFSACELAAYIAAVARRYGLLPAWLMGEQVRALGVQAGPSLGSRFPFRYGNPVLHLYFLTHLFMLETRYFHQPPLASRYADELAQLEGGLDGLITAQSWDLLAQCQVCLAACGRSSAAALEALVAARSEHGWSQAGHDVRQNAHTTAAACLALAMAGQA